jgi:hypothetical protein
VTVVQEFSTESITELAGMQSSLIRTSYPMPDHEPLSSFHRRLLEDARESIIGLPNRPVLKPDFLGRDMEFNNIPLHSPTLDSFDPFDVLPHSTSSVPVQQQPLVNYCTENRLYI